MSRSIAICPTSPSWRPNTTRKLCRLQSGALLAVCVALALWLGAARPAAADVAAPGELLLDLRARPAGAAVVDDESALAASRPPAPSYRRTGEAHLARVRVAPWPPVQGQTLTVVLSSGAPVTVTVSFDGRPYRAGSDAAPAGGVRSAWALVPVPPLQTPGFAPLVIRAGPETLTLNVPVAAGAFQSVNIPAATAGPILTEREKVAAETARMTKLFAVFTPGGFSPRSRFASPLRGAFAHSSPFGSRRTYGNDPALSAHAGEDFSAPAGTPVYAPAAGAVALAEPLFVRGNAIVLDHGNGVFTGYWHLSEIDVKPGDEVAPGQLLGKVGTTGLSTGAHLHWEMRVGGMAVDPLQWVK